jgi:hypothetical protein
MLLQRVTPPVSTHTGACFFYLVWTWSDRNYREDASVQVTGFKKSVHKKYTGWSAATQAWDATHQPVATPHTPPPLDRNRMMATPPATPRTRVAASVKASTTPRTRVAASTSLSSASPPATPSRPKRILYVYSRGEDTTVYADSYIPTLYLNDAQI